MPPGSSRISTLWPTHCRPVALVDQALALSVDNTLSSTYTTMSQTDVKVTITTSDNDESHYLGEATDGNEEVPTSGRVVLCCV